MPGENPFIISDPECVANEFTTIYPKALALARNAISSHGSLSSTTSSTDELLKQYYLSTASKKLFSAFLSIDLRNFTMLSNEKSTSELSSAVMVFSKAVANISSLSGGFVLKYVGDAVLCFYPARDAETSVDRALVSAAAISKAMKEVILPYLSEKKISTNFGIGVDAGDAAIIKVGSASTKLHYDLIGKAINFSVKLQSSAKKGEILTTENVFSRTSFKEFFTPVSLEKHPSGIKGALLKTKNLLFRNGEPERTYRFSPPEQDDF